MKSDYWKNQRKIIPTDSGESLSKSEIQKMMPGAVDASEIDDIHAFVESLSTPTERLWNTPRYVNLEAFRKRIFSEIKEGYFSENDLVVTQEKFIHIYKSDFEGFYKQAGLDVPSPILQIGGIKIYRFYICPRCYSIDIKDEGCSYEEFLASGSQGKWQELSHYNKYKCPNCGNESLFTIVFSEPVEKLKYIETDELIREFSKAAKELGIELFNKEDGSVRDTDGRYTYFYWDNLLQKGSKTLNKFPDELLANLLRNLSRWELQDLLNGEKEIKATGISYENLTKEERAQFVEKRNIINKRYTDEYLKEIIAEHVGCEIDEIQLWQSDREPVFYFVQTPDFDDVLLFAAPYKDDYDDMTLRSTRLICINMFTGEILGEGNAGDEG
ncbi:MAG: hypothetical protein JXR86_18900 [Spirochaetales bacterium]|nr:hypothetical protein [Spirochaetales bacterium]